MQQDIEVLRKKVLQAAESGVVPVIEKLTERPVFLMAPHSLIGHMHGRNVVAATKAVAAIDDVSTESEIQGIPRWTSAQFLERAKQYPNAIAIDFSCSHYVRELVAQLCKAAGNIERQDCALVGGQLKLPAVYETCDMYRDRTLARFDEYLAIADRFDDDFSRATLYSNLLFRLTYDRSHLLPTWTNPRDEYFSNYGQTSTFKLGSNEHFVDCGAHEGTIIQKFLGATQWSYKSITAFEPDSINFEKLVNVSALPLSNYRPIEKAVSSRQQKLRFMETGTMSSYVSAEGGSTIETTKLDDEVEKVTFLKMDIEGFETKALQGASHLLQTQRPRVAVCVYHLAHDVLDVLEQLDRNVENYHYRLRQHNGGWYYDMVLYGSPVAGLMAPPSAA